jgi:2-polyprenyl-3-methyl-5-hydroxy-6-metoxy-1,4-benzoquinol methylase
MASAQKLVDDYFESAAGYWDQLYSEPGLLGRIYQRRREVTLEWIREQDLAPDARILDVGCGAGATAVPLAAHGYNVLAVDRLPAMLQLVERNASSASHSASIPRSRMPARWTCRPMPST